MLTDLQRETPKPESNAAHRITTAFSQPFLQTKLVINTPGDEFEQEANRVSEQVMNSSGLPLGPAKCSCGGSCPKCMGEEHAHLQTKSISGNTTGEKVAPTSVHDALHSSGSELESTTRTFMEKRFGHNFSQVRVHDGELASQSAAEVNARAYTVGSDLFFGAGEYAPSTSSGRRLIAHELTHVLQQSATSGPPGLLQREDTSRDAPNAKSWNGAPSSCPSDFCQPLGSNLAANNRRAAKWGPFKGMIGLFVNPRVRPLWDEWAFGGSSSIKNFTKDFGLDFTLSPTTAKIGKFLLDAIKAKLTASPPTVPSGGSVTLDIPTLIPTEVAAIDTPGDAHEMNFSVIRDIPGNIAGGIGKDQAANPIGKNPSLQDDARFAKGDVKVVDVGSELMVVPNLNFTVNDTIDLCPGNCGSGREQIATVEMSRWEATGISGDVPFTVDFPAPPSYLTVPYTIPKPVPPPKAP
jgi:hypothetical protein